ncbi:RagB/SusD family nutrient uptake outer membrane protein [Arachidicoccus soli]|uniref:RagB/SusD family nutrient uptake outer membrane protein n=1 Tax=Arachidicoccus soli TaxID=2341117 RepID=A0A386HP99_9BACT|nr:RagB/SusD family nutrient uptake outer membrane protein [Arachidicoccus soli]AYD47768.1 RagB/SusD family nutrient uptake outer membrane protein [Arachidicoccus soli]
MNKKLFFKYVGIFLMISIMFWGINSCTKLDEVPYSSITANQFLTSRNSVILDFIRSFEHGYWSIQGNDIFAAEEDASDELMTPNRRGDWLNGNYFFRMHYHTWVPTDAFCDGAWTAFYQGAVLATNSLQDMESIKNPAALNVTPAELTDFKAELRTMRAWFHLRALDFYRNICLVKEVKDSTQSPSQVGPQEAFNFIQSELEAAIPDLPTRDQLGSNWAGRWTKAGAAALLARLYLNSKVWTGVDHFADCATICQDIINGKYGNYRLDSTWYGPFDYTNTSVNSEDIFVFPSTLNQTHWQYTSGMYWWEMTYDAPRYFGFSDWGKANTEFAMQPGRDVDSVEYPFALGKPFVKFQKYPDDYRLKRYRNLGNSKREGMFLYGYCAFTNTNGQPDSIRSVKDGGYPLFIRDQVGWFLKTRPGVPLTDKESDMNHADYGSGVYFIKYPFYPTTDDNRITSGYAEIRLTEIYYMLAECKYRAGDKAGAAALLNDVRKRDFPENSPSLYKADGSQLTDQEMIDEWGREFIGEGRRRTDLIRWGVFSTGTWWDKKPDADNHTDIFPIGINTINLSNGKIKQNPGYQ